MPTEVTEITGGTGRLHVDGTRQYTRVFEIYFDSTEMDPYQVMTHPLLPPAQSPHPNDSGSFCVGVSARQDSNKGHGNHWTVTYEYSERQVGSIEDLFSGQGQDPELREVEVSWSSNQTQQYDELSRGGYRICNSAGDPPVPAIPHFDAVRVCTLGYFVRLKPPGLMGLVNAINSQPFTIDGEYVAAASARVADIQVSKRVIVRGVVGRNITAVLEIGNPKTVLANHVSQIGSSASNPANTTLGYWEPSFLDKGRREYDSTLNGGSGGLATIENDDGSIPEEPALLNGKGVALTKPVAAGSEVWRYFSRYETLDFNLIRFPTF